MRDQLLFFNGVDGETGRYQSPPLSIEQLSRIVRKQPLGQWSKFPTFREEPTAGIDPLDLATSGWGVVFAHDMKQAVREALRELLDHRREMATRHHANFYREYTLQPGEDVERFLGRHGAHSPRVDPAQMPYYLLLVGTPQSIPFLFQHQLSLKYAVGRICFDEPRDYARYARSVTTAENRTLSLPKRAVFFGVENFDDDETLMINRHLVEPLVHTLAREEKDWEIESCPPSQTSKSRLSEVLGGGTTPAVLITASHGLAFEASHPHQQALQGALLCQNWPGPRAWQQPIPEEHYFAAHDVDPRAQLHGLIAFHLACHSAGVPRWSHRPQGAGSGRPRSKEFVARLPQRLLANPAGGALAVIGHIDQASAYSYPWPEVRQQLWTFEAALKRLLNGYPVGSALNYFSERYAELSVNLSRELSLTRLGYASTDETLVKLWTAQNDARSYVILGDPAVRLMTGRVAEPTVNVPGTRTLEPTEDSATTNATPTANTEPQQRLTVTYVEVPSDEEEFRSDLLRSLEERSWLIDAIIASPITLRISVPANFSEEDFEDLASQGQRLSINLPSLSEILGGTHVDPSHLVALAFFESGAVRGITATCHKGTAGTQLRCADPTALIDPGIEFEIPSATGFFSEMKIVFLEAPAYDES